MKELLHIPRDWLRKVRRAGRRRFFPVLDTRGGNLRLPPAVLLDSVAQSSPGTRARLFRRLVPYLFAPAATPSSAVCEINSLSEYEAAFASLAAILGKPGKTPPPGEVEFLRSILHRPFQHSGTISSDDYFFLTAFVSILAPRRVVEIGTLTGFSAVMIAAALDRQPPAQGSRWVDTIDHAPECFIDRTRPTGFEIAEVFPELAPLIRLHVPRDSTAVRDLAEPHELEMVFIDANHQHPLPLLDLLRVAPYVRPGGWIVLHDIRLATKAREANGTDPALRWGAAEGAELLFEAWPFRKISGGNIGAVQLPEEKSALIPFALRLMSVPYEIKGGSAEAVHRDLHGTFAELVRARR